MDRIYSNVKTYYDKWWSIRYGKDLSVPHNRFCIIYIGFKAYCTWGNSCSVLKRSKDPSARKNRARYKIKIA